jgi:hypothetical protein
MIAAGEPSDRSFTERTFFKRIGRLMASSSPSVAGNSNNASSQQDDSPASTQRSGSAWPKAPFARKRTIRFGTSPERQTSHSPPPPPEHRLSQRISQRFDDLSPEELDLLHIEQVCESKKAQDAADELFNLGVSAQSMRLAGFSARHLRLARYTLEMVEEGGYSEIACALAGFGSAPRWTYTPSDHASKSEALQSRGLRETQVTYTSRFSERAAPERRGGATGIENRMAAVNKKKAGNSWQTVQQMVRLHLLDTGEGDDVAAEGASGARGGDSEPGHASGVDARGEGWTPNFHEWQALLQLAMERRAEANKEAGGKGELSSLGGNLSAAEGELQAGAADGDDDDAPPAPERLSFSRLPPKAAGMLGVLGTGVQRSTVAALDAPPEDEHAEMDDSGSDGSGSGGPIERGVPKAVAAGGVARGEQGATTRTVEAGGGAPSFSC